MKYVMQLVSLADGSPSPFDNEYLVEYDPERDGTDPAGAPMDAYLRTTTDPQRALHFRNPADGLELWRKISERDPVRPDGKPNRPLTAFTVTMFQLDE